MEYENNPIDSNDDIEQPVQGTPVQQPTYEPVQRCVPPRIPSGKRNKKKKRIGFFGVLFRLIFVVSLIGNFFMLIAVIGLAALFSGSSEYYFEQTTLFEGNDADMIAIINLEGEIDSNVSKSIGKQFEEASLDDDIKAVILRIDSPGGTVAASDQIHHEISKFRSDTGKPVVAFMQNVAASGGYYSAVACDEIVAEPTVITGSIGVIMHNFVLKDLLEEKLGITPVTIKSGLRKDWPSTFDTNTPEQIEYIQEKLIGPAYNRFVELVAEGRSDKLTREEAENIADGSIFSAPEALDKKLIDGIGYIEEAVDAAEKLAGIRDAKVFEYKSPFSFASILAAESKAGISIDRDLVSKFTTPQLLYMWDASWY